MFVNYCGLSGKCSTICWAAASGDNGSVCVCVCVNRPTE